MINELVMKQNDHKNCDTIFLKIQKWQFGLCSLEEVRSKQRSQMADAVCLWKIAGWLDARTVSSSKNTARSSIDVLINGWLSERTGPSDCNQRKASIDCRRKTSLLTDWFTVTWHHSFSRRTSLDHKTVRRTYGGGFILAWENFGRLTIQSPPTFFLFFLKWKLARAH